jgi:NitT/TauT family transport system substrate-binding protein
MNKNITRISLGFDPTIENREVWNRREFLTAALAGTSALLGLRSESLAAEPALETTKLRMVQVASTCFAPQYIAEQLLRADGFSDVQYVKTAPGEPAPWSPAGPI